MTDAPLHLFVADPLPRPVVLALERLRRAPGVRHVAAMPDAHLAHTVCIGTVLATTAHLYPAAVGGDIGCGVATVRVDGGRPLDDAAAEAILGLLGRLVPTQAHREPLAWPEDLPPAPPSGCARRRDVARQLGTVGRGNHFVEVQEDSGGARWVMVHSGSRGAGQRIRDHHSPAGPALAPLDAGAAEGRAYLADLGWARAYAVANRRALLTAACVAVEAVLGGAPAEETYVDCDHNHARWEEDVGWVHRKGAISAAEGEAGLVPGSMGTSSFHTRGRGCPEALCSSSHGAGRRFDRTTARRTITVAALERQMSGVYFRGDLGRRLLDEAPAAYRDIGAVMRAQRDLTRVVRRVEPVLNYKGG